MKLQHLLSEAKKMSSKLQTLRQIFTPENIKDHYDFVMAYMSRGMPAADFDDLVAKTNKTNMDPDEVQFQYLMILKALPPEVLPKMDYALAPGNKTVESVSFNTRFRLSFSKRGVPNRFYCSGDIFFFKSAWYVEAFYYDKNGMDQTDIVQKFKSPEEALQAVLGPAREVAARIRAAGK